MSYKVQLLDLKKQYGTIKKDVDGALKRVIDEQCFILGKDVDDLEKEIASYCGTKYAVGVASGTDAIQLALQAAGVGKTDEVITVPFTFIATAEAISNIGAKPVFVDIDPKTYNMDPTLIEKKITNKTKAIVPVHLYGQCVDMDRIMAIAKKHDLKVVEDCAQAIGAVFKDKKAGSLGSAGAISFFPSKNLGGFGDGGMVVTDDEKLYERVKLLHLHGSSARYIHSIIGYNSRLDTIQAAVLRVKLKHLDKWSEARRENAEYYNRSFSKINEITVPTVTNHNIHVYHQYVVMVDSKKRDKLMDFLGANGIEARVYYPIPVHLQDCYKDLGYKKGDLSVAEKAALGTLALPVYPELEADEKQLVVNKVTEFFNKGL